MTGLPRWAIAAIGLVIGSLAFVAAVVLGGAASLCGLPDNQVASGYCAAGDTLRLLLVVIPAATVLAGYAISVWTGRLSPIAIAAICAVGEGLLALRSGY